MALRFVCSEKYGQILRKKIMKNPCYATHELLKVITEHNIVITIQTLYT